MMWMLHTAALILSGLFAGGAMMQTVVDHPARLSIKGTCAVNQMQRSLERVDPYMPGLATASAMTGAGAFFFGAPINDLIAAALFVAIGILTFSLIIPINKKILSTDLTGPDVSPTLALMGRWGLLHAFRSAAGTLALVLLASASLFAVR